MHGFLLGAWIACQSFDATTTSIGLARPGFKEVNPVMRGHVGVSLKVGINLGGIWFQHRPVVQRGGWRRMVLPAAFAAVGCAAGVSNVIALRQERNP